MDGGTKQLGKGLVGVRRRKRLEYDPGDEVDTLEEWFLNILGHHAGSPDDLK